MYIHFPKLTHMKIVLIGSGNLATIIGRLAILKNHEIVLVSSRTLENAKALADEFNCAFSNYSEVNSVEADIYILAISDSAIENTLLETGKINGLLVHTAGSISINVLADNSSQYGVLYPLQTLRKNMDAIPEIPLLIDGNNDNTYNVIKGFAETLSSWVKKTGDTERLNLHAAAVIVSNFTNHLYFLGEDFCEKENLDFNLLKPLIIETANRIINHSPSEMQTGPAKRHDIQTLEKHLRLLSKYPKLRTTYMRLTDSIMNL
ncbi:MAG: F420-dependent NADP oxidoreductase [Ferruginibacter sp.]